jgi:hypothetical protein
MIDDRRSNDEDGPAVSLSDREPEWMERTQVVTFEDALAQLHTDHVPMSGTIPVAAAGQQKAPRRAPRGREKLINLPRNSAFCMLIPIGVGAGPAIRPGPLAAPLARSNPPNPSDVFT